MIPSLFALACTADTPEPAVPAERVAVCVGEGEADSGADGVVDSTFTHQLGDGWSELVSESADGTSTSARSQTFDERGQLLTEDYAVTTPEDGTLSYSATWVRDPEGLLLTYVIVDSTGFEIREDYTYEDGLLVQVARRISGEEDPSIELYTNDADGRVVERRGDAIGVIQYQYFDAAPSLDSRMTQDANGDGALEVEATSYYDRAGRPIFLSSTRWDGTWTTAAYAYGPTGDELWSQQVREHPDGTRYETEGWTDRDEDGHPLQGESVTSWLAPGSEEVVSRSLSTWTWDCTD